jgi:hypothetical protein
MDEVLGACVHGVADLTAKAPRAQWGGVTEKELAVKPRGTASVDLLLKAKVRAHRERDPLSTGPVFEPAQLDDAPGFAITGSVEIIQANVVGATIDTIDDRVGGGVELIIQAPRHKPPDYGVGSACIIDRKIADAAFNALLGQATVDPLDNVGTLAKCPKHGLGVLR